MNRRNFLGTLGAALGVSTSTPVLLTGITACSHFSKSSAEALYQTRNLTPPGSFTSGVEGPAVDASGFIYAVNFQRQHTIGRVHPDGNAQVFVELGNGSIANGIRFDSRGDMLLADYVNHNILRVNMVSRQVHVFAHEPRMNQPNDIAITRNDLVFASDPNWGNSTGNVWRIDTRGRVTLLEENMGTTNGIEVSSNERLLYVNESVQRRVWVYDLSEQGEIDNKRLLIDFSDHGLDGMRCDADGNLYITRYGKGTVVVVTPEGEILREIEVAEGRNVSNLAFGGPDGRTVYVTVADAGNIQTFRTDRPGRSWQIFQERS